MGTAIGSLPHRQLRNYDTDDGRSSKRSLPHRQLRNFGGFFYFVAI